MRFADPVRELRKPPGSTQQKLAAFLSVSLSYLSKFENERLNVGDYPSQIFVPNLAEAIDADANELLLLTDRVPEAILRGLQRRPEALRLLAGLDDRTLDKVMQPIGITGASSPKFVDNFWSRQLPKCLK